MRRARSRGSTRTLVDEFLSQQPFFTGAPRNAAGRHYSPAVEPPTITDLYRELSAWIHRYNTSRAHRGINGETPLHRWTDDTAALTLLPPAATHALLPSATRKVQKDGINFAGLKFSGAVLRTLVGESVCVRYRAHDLSEIYIFVDDEFLGLATPIELLSEAEREQIVSLRRKDKQRSSRERRRATTRLGRRLAPLTAGDDAIRDTRTVSRRQGVKLKGSDERRSHAPKKDLLGLGDD